MKAVGAISGRQAQDGSQNADENRLGLWLPAYPAVKAVKSNLLTTGVRSNSFKQPRAHTCHELQRVLRPNSKVGRSTSSACGPATLVPTKAVHPQRKLKQHAMLPDIEAKPVRHHGHHAAAHRRPMGYQANMLGRPRAIARCTSGPVASNDWLGWVAP